MNKVSSYKSEWWLVYIITQCNYSTTHDFFCLHSMILIYYLNTIKSCILMIWWVCISKYMLGRIIKFLFLHHGFRIVLLFFTSVLWVQVFFFKSFVPCPITWCLFLCVNINILYKYLTMGFKSIAATFHLFFLMF